MAELIEKEKAIAAINRMVQLPDSARVQAMGAVSLVKAVEVVQGMWLWYSEDIYTCSNCYEKSHVKEVMGQPAFTYCPHCGAYMGGERKVEDG